MAVIAPFLQQALYEDTLEDELRLKTTVLDSSDSDADDIKAGSRQTRNGSQVVAVQPHQATGPHAAVPRADEVVRTAAVGAPSGPEKVSYWLMGANDWGRHFRQQQHQHTFGLGLRFRAKRRSVADVPALRSRSGKWERGWRRHPGTMRALGNWWLRVNPGGRLESLFPVLNPNTRGKLSWDVFVMALVLYNAVTVPLAFSFGMPDAFAFGALEYTLTAMYALDIAVSFRTAYYDGEGEMVRDSWPVARHYLLTWFPVDFLATVPFDAIGRAAGLGGQGSHSQLMVLAVFKTPRLLRLIKLVRFLDRLKNANAIKVLQLILLMVMIAHWLACIWYIIARFTPREEVWGFDTLHDHSKLTWYLSAFYYSFLMLLGDKREAANNYERLFYIIGLVAGACFYSAVVGNMALLVANMSTVSVRYRQKLDMTQDALRYMRVPEAQRERVQAFYDYVTAYSHPSSEGLGLLTDLTKGLNEDIHMFLHQEPLKRIYLFKGCEPAFIRTLATRMKIVTFIPREVIFRQGDLGQEMYIIRQGCVAVLSKTNEYMSLLKPGDFFGEIALLTQARRTAKCIALSNCDLAVLNSFDLKVLMKEFPDSAQTLQAAARERLRQLKIAGRAGALSDDEAEDEEDEGKRLEREELRRTRMRAIARYTTGRITSGGQTQDYAGADKVLQGQPQPQHLQPGAPSPRAMSPNPADASMARAGSARSGSTARAGSGALSAVEAPAVEVEVEQRNPSVGSTRSGLSIFSADRRSGGGSDGGSGRRSSAGIEDTARTSLTFQGLTAGVSVTEKARALGLASRDASGQASDADFSGGRGPAGSHGSLAVTSLTSAAASTAALTEFVLAPGVLSSAAPTAAHDKASLPGRCSSVGGVASPPPEPSLAAPALAGMQGHITGRAESLRSASLRAAAAGPVPPDPAAPSFPRPPRSGRRVALAEHVQATAVDPASEPRPANAVSARSSLSFGAPVDGYDTVERFHVPLFAGPSPPPPPADDDEDAEAPSRQRSVAWEFSPPPPPPLGTHPGPVSEGVELAAASDAARAALQALHSPLRSSPFTAPPDLSLFIVPGAASPFGSPRGGASAADGGAAKRGILRARSGATPTGDEGLASSSRCSSRRSTATDTASRTGMLPHAGSGQRRRSNLAAPSAAVGGRETTEGSGKRSSVQSATPLSETGSVHSLTSPSLTLRRHPAPVPSAFEAALAATAASVVAGGRSPAVAAPHAQHAPGLSLTEILRLRHSNDKTVSAEGLQLTHSTGIGSLLRSSDGGVNPEAEGPYCMRPAAARRTYDPGVVPGAEGPYCMRPAAARHTFDSGVSPDAQGPYCMRPAAARHGQTPVSNSDAQGPYCMWPALATQAYDPGVNPDAQGPYCMRPAAGRYGDGVIPDAAAHIESLGAVPVTPVHRREDDTSGQGLIPAAQNLFAALLGGRAGVRRHGSTEGTGADRTSNHNRRSAPVEGSGHGLTRFGSVELLQDAPPYGDDAPVSASPTPTTDAAQRHSAAGSSERAVRLQQRRSQRSSDDRTNVSDDPPPWAGGSDVDTLDVSGTNIEWIRVARSETSRTRRLRLSVAGVPPPRLVLPPSPRASATGGGANGTGAYAREQGRQASLYAAAAAELQRREAELARREAELVRREAEVAQREAEAVRAQEEAARCRAEAARAQAEAAHHAAQAVASQEALRAALERGRSVHALLLHLTDHVSDLTGKVEWLEERLGEADVVVARIEAHHAGDQAPDFLGLSGMASGDPSDAGSADMSGNEGRSGGDQAERRTNSGDKPSGDKPGSGAYKRTFSMERKTLSGQGVARRNGSGLASALAGGPGVSMSGRFDADAMGLAGAGRMPMASSRFRTPSSTGVAGAGVTRTISRRVSLTYYPEEVPVYPTRSGGSITVTQLAAGFFGRAGTPVHSTGQLSGSMSLARTLTRTASSRERGIAGATSVRVRRSSALAPEIQEC